MHALEFISIYLFGAIGYGSIELLWRGYTHWTMLLVGGLCFYIIYLIATRMREPLWKKLLLCVASISAIEFSVGCLVNLHLGWHVWDYSTMPYDLMGQICPQFCFFWLLLSWPCLYLSVFLRKYVFEPNMKTHKKAS